MGVRELKELMIWTSLVTKLLLIQRIKTWTSKGNQVWILFQRIQGCSILWRAQVKAHEKENYLFCLECPQLFLSNNLLKNRSRTIYWIPSKIFMMSWACDISWLCNLVASSNIFRHVSQMKAFLLEWAIRWFLMTYFTCETFLPSVCVDVY